MVWRATRPATKQTRMTAASASRLAIATPPTVSTGTHPANGSATVSMISKAW